MQIVEVDGVWTEPANASMIYISSAQRYSVLVTTKNETNANYAMVGSMDTVSLLPVVKVVLGHTDMILVSPYLTRSRTR